MEHRWLIEGGEPIEDVWGLVLEPPEGACAGIDSDIFFPERGESTRQAKEICAGCPVRDQCLAYAIDTGQKHGIWGGRSERERRRMRRWLHAS